MKLLKAKQALLGIVLAAATGGAFAAGALAIDSNQGPSYGWAVSYPSMGEAERAALGRCGGNCQIVLRFPSGCGAYVADQTRGSTIYSWATDNSGPAAQNRAMSLCQQRGGRSCIVRAWGCNGGR